MATVSEVRVEDGYVKASFGGIELLIKEQNGFVNGTRLCFLCSVKGKDTGRFNCSSGRKYRKSELSEYYGQMTNSLARTTKHHPSLIGMYFHPALLLDLANWLSPQTYVAAAIIMDAFFHKTEKRKRLLIQLFKCEEMATYEDEPPGVRVRYEGLELVVNERGWFKTSCDVTAKVKDFEKVKPTLEYFRAKGLDGAPGLYHPLLFLRLVAGMDAKSYVRSARVIFCCEELRVQSLIRREIAAAGRSNVESATPNTSTNGMLAELTAPSTSFGPARGLFMNANSGICKISIVEPARLMQNGGGLVDGPSTSGQPEPDWSNVIYNDSDDDSQDSNMTMDMTVEVRPMLTREEHEVELDRVRQLLELDVKRERCEKEAALAKLRIKDDQLEELRRQLKGMTISDSPRVSRKRSCKESVASAADTDMNNVRVDKLECLVLFLSTENKVYVYRRKLRSIVPAIHKQLHKVAAFVGWFVTNNAVLAYRCCKQQVSENAKACGRVVRLYRNEMELMGEEGAEFDLLKSIRTTLSIDMKVLAADVELLGELFHKPIHHRDDAVAVDPEMLESSSDLLDRVHQEIRKYHDLFMSRQQMNPPGAQLGS